MRPAVFQVGGTLYWTILTRDPDTLVAKDADSTPSVAVTRNNTPSADSVTVTKRSATTGIYDCSYNPAAETEGETFHFLETATVTGTTTASRTYPNGWVARCVAVERGTDGANTTAPSTPANVTDARDAVLAKLPAALVGGKIDASVGAYQSGLTPLQPLVSGRQLAVSATTGKVTAEAVELGSTATAALVDLIWDEPLTGATHNVATSSGKRLRQTTAFQQIDSTVIDASATTTTFVTGLTSSVDNFYNDSMIVFTDGALAGQVRAIYDYIGATKTIVLEEALTSAPVNGVAFAIVSLHIHPVSQIQSGLATSAALVTLRGTDNDTLKTLSDQIDTVSADVSSIASVSREAF